MTIDYYFIWVHNDNIDYINTSLINVAIFAYITSIAFAMKKT